MRSRGSSNASEFEGGSIEIISTDAAFRKKSADEGVPRSTSEGGLPARMTSSDIAFLRHRADDSTKKPAREVLLCGDIGGTNSRLVLYDVNSKNMSVDDLDHIAKVPAIVRQTLKNAHFDTFAAVIRRFLFESNLDMVKIVAGCLAVAGPVEDDRVTFTNRDGWVIDARSLEEEFMIPHCSLCLVNDFTANGFGALTLESHEYEQLGPQCDPIPGAPIAVVGAGTGLGETYVTSSGGVWESWPSEGGHVNFSPRNQKECSLLMFLLEKFNGRVSTERVVSGKGIVNVFEFLAHEDPNAVNTALAEKIHMDEEGAGLISQACYDDPMCKEAIETVMALYGCEVGNTVVKWLPFGGLYIAGGIAMKNMDFIQGEDSPFMVAYKDRGRMSHLISKVPLRFVNIDDLGLRGAHYVAFRKRLWDSGLSPRKMSTDREYRTSADQETHEGDDIQLTSAVLAVRDAVRAGTFAVGALTTAVLLLAFANLAKKS